MITVETAQAAAVIEKDPELASVGVMHAMLDSLEAAANTDVNELRKTLAVWRASIADIGAAIVAKSPLVAPVPLTEEQVDRRNALRVKPDKTPYEVAEVEALEARPEPAGSPGTPVWAPLNLIETQRRDALRIMPNRSPVIVAELAALEARSDPMPSMTGNPAGAPLTVVQAQRRDVLLAMSSRSPSEEAELKAMDAQVHVPAQHEHGTVTSAGTVVAPGTVTSAGSIVSPGTVTSAGTAVDHGTVTSAGTVTSGLVQP